MHPKFIKFSWPCQWYPKGYLWEAAAFLGIMSHMILMAMLLATLGTTAEVNALLHDEQGPGRPFSLTGTVSSVLVNSHCVLEDGTGRAHIRNISSTGVEPGDKATFSGTISVDAYLQKQLTATNVVIHGHGTPYAHHPESVRRIVRGEANFANVVIEGTAAGCFPDDIDSKWNYLIIHSEGSFTYVSVPNEGRGDRRIEDFSRAVVAVRGTVIHGHCGARHIVGPHVETTGFNAIRILQPPPTDSIASIPELNLLTPEDVVRLGSQTLEGRVTARWGDTHLLILDDHDGVHRIDLLTDTPLPAIGSQIRAVGQPETDLYRINLSKARCETIASPETVPPEEVPDDESVSMLPSLRHIRFHGRLVRVSGRIGAEAIARTGWRAILETDRRERVAVDISTMPELNEALAVGNVVTVTGCGLIETDNWQPGIHFPQQKELVVVVRSPADVQIISSPSWWTPQRLCVVIGTLFGLLIAVIIWNRILNRLVEKRGRQLYREEFARSAAVLRTEDRTRLAVELHDSLSQTLTGVAMQVDAVALAAEQDPAHLTRYVATARRTVDNCRSELKNCLWDLRNQALDESDAAEAVRKTISPLAGDAVVTIDFGVPRSHFSDLTFHDVLRVLRELVTNAVRHGHAGNIVITSADDGQTVRITVKDDGIGFDPSKRPGIADGHFGLDGIVERLRRTKGSLSIDSAPGCGTTITFTLTRNHT